MKKEGIRKGQELRKYDLDDPCVLIKTEEKR